MWHFLLLVVIFKVLVLIFHHEWYPGTFRVLLHQSFKRGIKRTTLKQFLRKVAKRPTPFTLRLGPLVFVTVYKPEHLQILLNSPHCQEKSSFYRFFHVDRGLFGAPVATWKHERKVLNPCFGPLMLPRFIRVFNEKVTLFTQQMAQHVGTERDFLTDIGRCIMDVLFVTSFGVDFDLQRNPEGSVYANLLGEFIHLVTKRLYSPWYYPDFLYRFSKSSKRECEILDVGYALSDRILQARLDQRSPSERNSSQVFIDKLLELNEKNEREDIQYLRDHLVTMILAGSDTSMAVLANIMLMLAIHQDIQERVYQELVGVIGTDLSASISQEDVAELKYLEMVCKETMRLFPLTGIIGRKTTKDIILDENIIIPANATVSLAFYQTYRDPTIWGPTATEFDPERFQPEVATSRHPYAFLPFSAGPRMCLGMRYAWLSMKIMLGHMLRRYRLRTSLRMEEITLDFAILMRIEQGCRISLELR